MSTRVAVTKEPISKPARGGLIRIHGRTARIREAVVAAVLGLVEAGETDWGIDHVASISGVHKSTVYRRWPTRDLLLAESLAERRDVLFVEAAADWRIYLFNLAAGFRQFYMLPTEQAALKALMAADAAYARDIWKSWRGRADALAEPLVNARECGQIAPNKDPHLVVMMISGFVLSHVLFNKLAPTDAQLRELVAGIAEGLAPRGVDEAQRAVATAHKG